MGDHLSGRQLPDGSSGVPGSSAGRVIGTCFALHRTGFGEPPCHHDAGGLLPTVSPLPGRIPAVSFLCHFPSAFAVWGFPSVLPCGVRTFLGRHRSGARGHPACDPQRSAGGLRRQRRGVLRRRGSRNRTPTGVMPRPHPVCDPLPDHDGRQVDVRPRDVGQLSSVDEYDTFSMRDAARASTTPIASSGGRSILRPARIKLVVTVAANVGGQRARPSRESRLGQQRDAFDMGRDLLLARQPPAEAYARLHEPTMSSESSAN